MEAVDELLATLPLDVWRSILRLLEPHALAVVMQLSRSLRELSSEPDLWAGHLRQRWSFGQLAPVTGASWDALWRDRHKVSQACSLCWLSAYALWHLGQ